MTNSRYRLFCRFANDSKPAKSGAESLQFPAVFLVFMNTAVSARQQISPVDTSRLRGFTDSHLSQSPSLPTQSPSLLFSSSGTKGKARSRATGNSPPFGL